MTLTRSGQQPQSPFTWNKGESDPWYATWPILPTDKVRYSWFATYIVKGSGGVSTKVTDDVTEPLLTLPANPPGDGQVRPFVPRPAAAVRPAAAPRSR